MVILIMPSSMNALKISSDPKLFIEYNTTVPSSAPVERLFSYGGLVLMPKRNILSDVRFEKMVIICYNKDFMCF